MKLYQLIVNLNAISRVKFTLPTHPCTWLMGRPTPGNIPEIPIPVNSVSRRLAEVKTSLNGGVPVHSIKKFPGSVNRFRIQKSTIYINVGDSFVLQDNDVFTISNSVVWFKYSIIEDDTEVIGNAHDTLY